MFQDRNLWIFTCFAIYVSLIAVFGGIYYAMYRRRPQRFLFAAGVQDSQLTSYTAAISHRIDVLTVENELLGHIQPRMEQGATPRSLAEQATKGNLASGCRFVFYLAHSGGPGQEKTEPLVEVSDSAGKVLATLRLPTRWFWQRWDDVYPLRRYRNEARIAMFRARLKSLSTSPHDIWSYWDFLYFSTISQTTVGFGDILPNATNVRLLVVVQVLLGYVLLAVLLNVVFHQ